MAVLISTVASAVGLTQVCFSTRATAPEERAAFAVHAVSDGRVHASEAERLMAVCGEGG
jgi:hypothetical protein